MPCFVLSYATRINAEQALSRGRQFKDKTLNVSNPQLPSNIPINSRLPQIVWFNPSVADKADVSAGADKSGDAKIDAKLDEEKKEGSDDEDIEEEERSWRRGYDAE